MDQTIIQIPVEAEIKAAMETVCEELGISISSAFTIFAKKVAREQRIPFDVSVDPFYSPKNMTAIDRSLKQLEEGKVVEKTLEELEASLDG